jgi:hypothetical protein
LNYTLYSVGSVTLTVRDSTVTASGGAGNYGVVSTVNSTATIHNSVIRGATDAVSVINSTGRIATSLVDGGISTSGSGTLICVGAYDQSFTALDASCQ